MVSCTQPRMNLRDLSTRHNDLNRSGSKYNCMNRATDRVNIMNPKYILHNTEVI